MKPSNVVMLLSRAGCCGGVDGVVEVIARTSARVLLFALLLASLSFLASGFVACHCNDPRAVYQARSNSKTSLGNTMGDGDACDDDDEPVIKPYRNRSLRWTLNYRRLNPYEKVRRRVIGFGHRSKNDWDEAVSSGQLGQYVPNHPDEMYAPEWVSWDEWLGIRRSYNDTKNLAANILGLKSLDDYLLFVKSDPKRAEGLRIPLRPDIVYRDDWIDEESFFGKQ